MQQRHYPNYAAYLDHQREKTLKPHLRKALLAKWDRRVARFTREFAVLRGRVPAGARALCLGARMGEEVQALQDMGLDAIGVDLVPRVPLVIRGDFHNLPFPPNAFALVYSNSIDHVFDLDRFTDEIRRVLTSPGWVLARLGPEDYGRYESLKLGEVDEFIRRFPGFTMVHRSESGPEGPAHRVHLLLTDAAEPGTG